MSNPDIVYIDSDQSLLSCCEALRLVDAVAVDTEFIRVSTFYPKPGLYQAYDGITVYLIDPITISQWKPFIDFLQDESVVKIFHACDEDVELFYHCLGVETINVFDTQIAAAFCGFDFSMGYQRLLLALLDVELAKEASRSNWLQRPLTLEQTRYAADDVIYLLQMYRVLAPKIEEKGFFSAAAEEVAIKMSLLKKTDFSGAYHKVRQAKKLSGKSLSILKGLAEWRELQMREINLPRNKIANNDVLMMLAKMQKFDLRELKKVKGVSRFVLSSEETLAQLIAVVGESGELVQRRRPMDMSVLNRLKQVMSAKADAVAIAESMFSKKTMNESLARASFDESFNLQDYVSGWRLPYYHQAIEEMGCLSSCR